MNITDTNTTPHTGSFASASYWLTDYHNKPLQETSYRFTLTPKMVRLTKLVDETPEATEIMTMWGEMNHNPPPPDWMEWGKLTDEQRRIVMNIVTAFSQNLHWFMKLAKNGGRLPR